MAEASKMVVLMLLTIIYLVFWMCLGILYSVLAKRTSTSIMASIATRLTFSIVITIRSLVLAGFLVPLPAGDFRLQTEDGRFQIAPEFREAMQKRMAVMNNIRKLSPTNLYEEAASDILGVAQGFMGRGDSSSSREP